ncbi:MAG: DUF2537 domain-containing protein [Actinophytocola sp.]|nr:DUF2537 domain-containing protein [Actinophytocola sp.]
MELRVRGDRAVLARSGSDAGHELAPEQLPLGPDLAAALHEWARVAAAMRKAATGQSAALSDPGQDAVGVVSRRGRQLAGRVATEMHMTVQYRDPVTDMATVVVPSPDDGRRRGPRHARGYDQGLFQRSPGEPTPWATGLAVSALMTVVVAVGMLGLVSTLERATQGWIAFAAAVVVSGGLLPSLWLGRRVPIVRWVCFGAAVGLAVSWIGALVLLL